MSTDKKPGSLPRTKGAAEPYLPWDPIPKPEAVEHNSDTMWEFWQKTHKAHEAGFAETAPASMSQRISAESSFAATEPAFLGKNAPAPSAPPLPAVKEPTAQDAMVEVRRNNRVCPSPARWQQLYEMLPNRQKDRPTPPLVGPSWLATPSLSKRMCLREQLEWAERNGGLGPVLAFLKQLPEEEWHHMGE